MRIQHDLFIARHGNTFDSGDIVRRVGKRTDLPLSMSGHLQAQQLGIYLQHYAPQLQRVLCSTLQRTQQTAQAVQHAFAPQPLPVNIRSSLDEVDYGPDENQPETQVIARIGQAALTAWDEQKIIPEGWLVDLPALQNTWQQISAEILQHPSAQTWLVITSQGIARFAECLLVEPLDSRKLATGAVCHLQYQQAHWRLVSWNVAPC
jgi:probable phosphoglycerate mutase